MREESGMKPSEVYAMPAERVTNALGEIKNFAFDHLPEVGDYDGFVNYSDIILPEVEIRIVKHFDFDGRRFWQMASVWHRQQPVMIVQNAGREGSDYSDRFITDPDLFLDMVRYIKACLPIEPVESVGIDEEVAVIGNFYGNDLNGSFQRY